MQYKVAGTIRIEYVYYVDETVDAESEDDALDAICEEFLPGDEDSTNYDTHGCNVTLIENEDEIPEDRRMRLIGMPMLPGL